ncbi:hypothetical protein J2125_003706 [Erwinia toletana]|uniref:Uncharacterized protein n=1 Tax=Winslowiella toletana TaxID=92490 RepID=A0ABS4PCZ4_9GAMM|nr:hypothetical protein [Winslowiella toletana]MBP2170514.1 hypothetical protein [Winslowiella toletana]
MSFMEGRSAIARLGAIVGSRGFDPLAKLAAAVAWGLASNITYQLTH